MFTRSFKQSGVTLIELLVVIGIVFILFAIGIVSIGSLKDKSSLNQIASEIKSAIYLSQSKTINEDYYGIYFQQDSYSIFKGSSFVPGDPNNITQVLSPEFHFISINFPGQKILFSRISGYVSNFSSTTEITLEEIQTGQNKIISVNKYGLVEIR